MDEIIKKIENSKFLINDIIQGDTSLTNRSDFENMTFEEISQTLKILLNDLTINDNQKAYFLQNLWRINYKQKPPSIEEFLSSKWLGETALSIYPQVKETLCKFWSPDSYYRHLLLAPNIGWGKSTATAISILYVMTHLNLMRNPKKFYNKNDANPIVAVLGSFTLTKAKQVLLSPFYEILQNSPKFRRVLKEDRVESVQLEEYESGSNRIVWTRASKAGGDIEFSNDLHIIRTSSIGAILGLTIITGAISEISFFLGEGISAEEISQMYNDLKARVWSRFGDGYFATTVIDSSPNSFDSPIDRFVFSGEAEKDDRNLVVKSTHWDVYGNDLTLYPKWIKTKETFPVFRGTGSKPPLILGSDQVSLYNTSEIFNVPIDLKPIFDADLPKAVKDYCGWPAGSNDKLIDDFEIIEKMFSPVLKNIYTYIKAPAKQNPERLIWNQIYKDFFIEIAKDHYEFYRAPYEKRFIGVDMSETGDITGISSVHPEMDRKGQLVVVADFTIAIVPGKERINLTAIEYFIRDLKKLGRFHIEKITFDQYQSSSFIQNLKRDEYNVERFSVDIDTAPYFVFISWMKSMRIKCGRNIFLKNNLKSLQETETEKGRKKVDHIIGKLVFDDGADWKLSLAGCNSKDISDSLAAASFNCINTCIKYISKYQWDDEEKSYNEDIEDVLCKKALENIHKEFSYRII
jgi:hypothetical protein